MVSLLKSALANCRRTSRGPRFRSNLESLESRSLLSAGSWPGLLNPQLDAEPNNTLDSAQSLGSVFRVQGLEFAGSIGTGTDRNTDVDWFRFTLRSAGQVQITSLPNALDAISPIVLTLYGDQVANFDPAVPLQHRLLGRSESHSDAAKLNLSLKMGTYFVAVSGAGNRFFHPFVTDSGLPGAASDYGIRIEVSNQPATAGTHDQFAAIPERGRLGDDTPATATYLGDLATIGRLQVSGAIGDDPFYNVKNNNPYAMNSAADVDLYHFTIAGDGPFALVAESFAGRIGSALDPALTLYRADEFGSLQFVASNNNTLNEAKSTDGQFPFFTDAVLYSRLTAGEYFLAVSSSGNDSENGPDGTFDPQFAHSGINGGSVGNYVLDFLVYPDDEAPRVIATTPVEGSTQLRSPRQIEVQFSELVNLQQLAFTAFVQVGESTVSSVFVQDADGRRYFPRLQTYDPTTGVARFLMLDGLPNGTAELHVSGALGLTDLAGNPLTGNDPSGDFVSRFVVADATRVEPRWKNAPGNESFDSRQDLGVFFPHELQAGVIVTRDASTNARQSGDNADYFQFEVLQAQSYFLSRTNTGSGIAPALQVFDLEGNVVKLSLLPRGQGLRGFLQAGTYVLRVGSWDATTSDDVKYRIEIKLGGVSENPTPLTSGAAPAVGIRLLSNGSTIPQMNQAPIVYSAPINTDTSTAGNSTIPNNLLRGLEVAPLGGNGTTVTSPSNDTAIVRLFGFSNRDVLFSGLDSLQRPTSRQSPFSLSNSDLLDLALGNMTRDDEETPAEMLDSDSVAAEESLEDGVPAAPENDESDEPSETSSRDNSGKAPGNSRDAVEPDRTSNKTISAQPAADESMSVVWPMSLITALTMGSSLRDANAAKRHPLNPARILRQRNRRA